MTVKILTQTVVRHDEQRSSIAAGQYVWRGPANAPVFLLQNCRDYRIENIDVSCETPCSAVFYMERTKSGPGVIPSTMHMFRNVRIFGNDFPAFGIWYHDTIDENNEHGRFDCVSVYGCDCAFKFQGQQSKEHLLTHCRLESGLTAIASDTGFQMIGGTIAVFEEAVILARAGDPVTLSGVGVETCGRLLESLGPTTGAQPVVLQNVRYEADQLAPDGEAIVMRHAGPLTIIGGRYGGGKQPIPRIALRGVGIQSVELVGRPHFGSYGAHAVNPIIAQNPPEAMVTGGYLAQRYEGDPSNTAFIGSPTVERITT